MPRKQRGGDPIKDRSFCKGNNYDEDEGCFQDPVTLDCVDDKNFFRTVEGHCFNLDSLKKSLRVRPVNPMTGVMFSSKAIDSIRRGYNEEDVPIFIAKIKKVTGIPPLTSSPAILSYFNYYFERLIIDGLVYTDIFSTNKGYPDVAVDLAGGYVLVKQRTRLKELNESLATGKSVHYSNFTFLGHVDDIKDILNALNLKPTVPTMQISKFSYLDSTQRQHAQRLYTQHKQYKQAKQRL